MSDRGKPPNEVNLDPELTGNEDPEAGQNE
jgi:hypothetical protein